MEYGFRKQEVCVEQHPVITKDCRGDLIGVIRYVKDDDGLIVKNFLIALNHKSPDCEKCGYLQGAQEKLKRCNIS